MKKPEARHSDVIVVGGGIMGASSAFFLARRGLSVRLIERDLVGQAASGTNFGNVRRQGRWLHQLPLSLRAHAIWQRLPELIGEDCEYVKRGHLRAAYTPEFVDKIETYARDARDCGLDLEVLSTNMLRDRFPYLGPEITAGVWDREGGHANPRLTAPAFGRAAVREGVDLMENAEVTGVTRNGGDFIVEIEGKGEFRAPVLLVTAGAWGGRLSTMFAEPVPIEVAGPGMAVTEPLPYRIEPSISMAVGTTYETVYFRQVERGNIVIGGSTRGPASIYSKRAKVIPGNVIGQMEQIRRMMPAFARVNIIRVWSGVESYFADDVPVMGPSGTTAGLFYAFGFCGAGFQVGPGVGDVMAQLIATGATDTPLAPYSITRFAGYRPA
ncbi:NAD(P)/FAD-dependent oxidoreductase [Novosphingobium aerophilum]|uniref:NAD(P)/FAD-dependent oxidoreductase n=1 Tax=Novosphingobium TaxID=165696 RepID=UPI002D769BFD|nr:FAD-dependent oxidoreductase [Novosphingobium sp. RL4]WRT96063.1 FAD-dependent oxidoreductase [Novosphingobium sp. RL4]